MARLSVSSLLLSILLAAVGAIGLASAPAMAQDALDRPTTFLDAPSSGVGSNDAARVAGDGARPAAQGDFTFLYLMFAVIGALILFSILTSRKERKRREALLAGIRKHDKVQTVGGIIGSVVEVKPETVVIKVDEASNTRLTFARSAVQQVLKESSESRKDEKSERADAPD